MVTRIKPLLQFNILPKYFPLAIRREFRHARAHAPARTLSLSGVGVHYSYPSTATYETCVPVLKVFGVTCQTSTTPVPTNFVPAFRHPSSRYANQRPSEPPGCAIGEGGYPAPRQKPQNAPRGICGAPRPKEVGRVKVGHMDAHSRQPKGCPGGPIEAAAGFDAADRLGVPGADQSGTLCLRVLALIL